MVSNIYFLSLALTIFHSGLGYSVLLCLLLINETKPNGMHTIINKKNNSIPYSNAILILVADIDTKSCPLPFFIIHFFFSLPEDSMWRVFKRKNCFYREKNVIKKLYKIRLLSNTNLNKSFEYIYQKLNNL